MKLFLATNNKGKLREMHAILSTLVPEIELLDVSNYPNYPEPEETGSTMEENAIIKVEAAYQYTGLPCIADDGGLEVDALGGSPGVHSKRFGGEHLPFNEKINLLLDLLKDVGEEERTAQYRCVMAVKIPEVSGVRTFTGICPGKIGTDTRGSNGFGFDSVFYLPNHSCTMAELDVAEKNEISHRYKALMKAARYIAEVSECNKNLQK